MPQKPHIALKNVHKHFGAKTVLDGVDLTLERGRSLVVIGSSGSGKSVLLKCILGLLCADAGGITVDGAEMVGIHGREHRKILAKCGVLFQGGALFDSLTVWQNVAFGLIHAKGIAAGQAREIALEKLAQVGLDGAVGGLSPAELSGGMQKRVALARAISCNPDIMFFDEPTSGLDPIMADVIDRLIVDCVERLGATAVSITHDMASVRRIADRIAMLYKGHIIWEGAAEDMDDSGNAYVKQFINARAQGPISADRFGP
ncbi:MAG: ATP-binding cassette domain-containing protein [Hyphomicrobiales bacterium]